jgi:hypothetical protein
MAAVGSTADEAMLAIVETVFWKKVLMLDDLPSSIEADSGSCS